MPYPDDTLLYQGRVYRLDRRPLEDWFALVGVRPAFRRLAAAEGGDDYSATWELGEDASLHLVGITGCWPDATPVSLAHLFPLMGETVRADWFSGTLSARPVASAGALTAEEPLMLTLSRGQRFGMQGGPSSKAAAGANSFGWAGSLV